MSTLPPHAPGATPPLIREPETDRRELTTVRLSGDFVIVGGGLAGTCAAITEGGRIVWK